MPPKEFMINPKTGRRYGWEEEQRQATAAERELEQTKRTIEAVRRAQRARECRDDLLAFTKFTMPDPEAINDIDRTRYEAARFHELVARVLEQVEKGEIKQLIFCMPPRHGKSELATKRFAAWYSGRHPEHDIIIAASGDDLAHDFGADIRAIMQSPSYKQVFPSHKLRKGGTAKDNIVTDRGGRLVAAGRGGQINGRGAHCFPGETLVETKSGARRIDSLAPGDEVLSYDIGGREIVWRKVQAVAKRPISRLHRLSTSAGRVVEVTADHQFFSDGGWTEAGQLTPGCGLVCAVRKDGAEARFRNREARQAGAGKFLLLKRMLGRRGEHKALRRAALLPMWWRSAEGEWRFWQPRTWALVLLERMLGPGARRRIGAARGVADDSVRAVQRDVCPGEQGDAVLQSTVCVSGTCAKDDEGRQPSLEKRGVCEPSKTSRDAAFSRITANGNAPRWRALRTLRRKALQWAQAQFRGASHRRERAEQQGEQLGDALPCVSRGGSFFRGARDFVRKVEDARRSAVVFDIQVEGTECFFANGILAHNCLLVDDLYKDAEEARSQTIRDKAWEWFTKVALYRRMGKRLTIVTMTRWHSDDIIGRLTDPENPCYNEKEAQSWKIIRLPGLAEEDDPLGRQPGEALWPEVRRDGTSYDVEYHLANQRRDPLGFAALTQQRPTVADGILFRRETIQYYEPHELPDSLRIYCASDHAVGTDQRNDPSCLIKVGVDPQNNIYLLDTIWRRMPTDQAVEAMLAMAGGNMRPLLWWAERGHISKSIGPFLRKRMLETNTYINLVEVTPAVDKEQRAQSIAARVAMGKVYFPKGAWWTEKAINEMLAFPNGTHDDFVDSLAYIGLGLQSQFGPSQDKPKPKMREGSYAWLKQNDKWAEVRKKATVLGGF